MLQKTLFDVSHSLTTNWNIRDYCLSVHAWLCILLTVKAVVRGTDTDTDTNTDTDTDTDTEGVLLCWFRAAIEPSIRGS